MLSCCLPPLRMEVPRTAANLDLHGNREMVYVGGLYMGTAREPLQRGESTKYPWQLDRRPRAHSRYPSIILWFGPSSVRAAAIP